MKKIFFYLFIGGLIFVLVASLNYFFQNKENSLDRDFYLTLDNIDRRYKVHLPISYDVNKKIPMILNLHGSGGNADSMASMTNMNQTADKYGFIVVYPEGTGQKILGKSVGGWNAGMSEKLIAVDDVGFISALIDDLKNKFNIDESKIYASGISNGAQMSYRLACELSDKITAIAPVGSQWDWDINKCAMKRPVPTIHFHGTEDNCALYNGGMCGGCFQKYFQNISGKGVDSTKYPCESVLSFIKKWANINKVSTESSKIILQNGSSECISYKDENNKEGEVVFCTIAGMGHTWPGGGYGLPCDDDFDSKKCQEYVRVVGELNGDISANEMMWEFFSKFSIK